MSVRLGKFAISALGVAVLTASIQPTYATAAASPHLQTAVLAGGCFWGMEDVFEQVRGVSNVVVGYAGGTAATAHYDIVSTGTTGHAESVEITYDPSKISYARLLDVYFKVAHDPTELNYQGPDEGKQYRSEIFYTDRSQARIANEMIHTLTARHVFHAPIVTAVVPFTTFYPAEAYHQHFAERNPNYPYIVMVDAPKVADLRREFPGDVKKADAAVAQTR